MAIQYRKANEERMNLLKMKQLSQLNINVLEYRASCFEKNTFFFLPTSYILEYIAPVCVQYGYKTFPFSIYYILSQIFDSFRG